MTSEGDKGTLGSGGKLRTLVPSTAWRACEPCPRAGLWDGRAAAKFVEAVMAEIVGV
jgi:hypothetical protein